MKVWDPVVRSCHWTVAALVIFDLIYDDGGRAHRVVGYVAAAIVLFRLTWAALSRGHSIRPSFAETRAYLRLLFAGKPPRRQGLDPLGLWMVWLLWLLVLALGVTGWMSRLDLFWGDDTVHELHALLASVLAAAVAIHVFSVCAMSVVWRENLPAAMVSGRKRPAE